MRVEQVELGVQRILLDKGEQIEGLPIPVGCSSVLVYGQVEIKSLVTRKYRDFFVKVGKHGKRTDCIVQ